MGDLIVIVGKPKEGKTVSACTCPKPALMIDTGDRGFKSVKNAKNADGALVVPDWADITLKEIYYEGRTELNFTSFASENDKTRSAAKAPEYTKHAIEIMNQYEAIMDELFNKGTVTVTKDRPTIVTPNAEGGVEVGPFKSLIIDPLTSLFRLWKSAILDINKVGDLRRGDYMALEGILANQFVPNLKALNDKIPYIILTAHEDTNTNDKGDVLEEFSVGPTKNLGKNLSEFFDNVWRMHKVQKQYAWRTKAHGIFRGAGSRWDLPEIVMPATFKELETILKETIF